MNKLTRMLVSTTSALALALAAGGLSIPASGPPSHLDFGCAQPAQARSFYDAMLFHPRTEFRHNPDTVGGVAKRDVTFKAPDGSRLRGWYFDLPGSDKIVLVSEGNGGNMDYLTTLAEMLMQCNASVLLYDYEGYGQSEGRPSLRRVVNDGVAAYDYMSKNLAEKKKIVLLGVSLGTGVTSQILAQRKADAVILSSPFTSLLDMARLKIGYFKYIPTIALPRQHLDNVAAMRKEHPPLLILHGTDDELIPLSQSEALFASASTPKTFVKLDKAGHNDTFRLTKEAYLQALKDFFATLN
ncbi:MAG: alpha/beta hydrolase [Cyanobacteria bacterium REEB67]|nr:alpha/beta hydrolase [Cyanobacteria bacterium REEB67]